MIVKKRREYFQKSHMLMDLKRHSGYLKHVYSHFVYQIQSEYFARNRTLSKEDIVLDHFNCEENNNSDILSGEAS